MTLKENQNKELSFASMQIYYYEMKMLFLLSISKTGGKDVTENEDCVNVFFKMENGKCFVKQIILRHVFL